MSGLSKSCNAAVRIVNNYDMLHFVFDEFKGLNPKGCSDTHSLGRRLNHLFKGLYSKG